MFFGVFVHLSLYIYVRLDIRTIPRNTISQEFLAGISSNFGKQASINVKVCHTWMICFFVIRYYILSAKYIKEKYRSNIRLRQTCRKVH